MSVTTVSSSMITDATILNADIGAAAAIATTKLGAGAIVQVVNVQDGDVAASTALIPHDATVPQITEGAEFMTLAITPASTSNKLKIDVVAILASNAATNWLIGSLFNTDFHSTNAIKTMQEWHDTVNTGAIMGFTVFMDAPTTSATTFRFRAGSRDSGTTTFSGTNSSANFGDGHMVSSMTITEIKV